MKINKKIEIYKGLKVLKGLMFSKKKNILLVLPKESKVNIHSFFVFFPFKAVFLNSKKQVVDSKKIKPFTFYRSKKPAKYVLETPIQKLKNQHFF
jgi:uncharacterized membrane protein (UPF0127 family)